MCWLNFFSVKRTSRPQRICSCASQLFTNVLLFLGNGTIFREKISRDIFMPFLGYKKCDLKKKTKKLPTIFILLTVLWLAM